jgi:hypothetical protein
MGKDNLHIPEKDITNALSIEPTNEHEYITTSKNGLQMVQMGKDNLHVPQKDITNNFYI